MSGFSSAPPHEPADAPPPLSVSASDLPDGDLRILLVVDDPDVVQLFANVLPDQPTFPASDLAHALALAQGESPHVAFLDVALGNRSALALVSHLKVLAGDLTVYALVRPDAIEAGAQALALGASGLLTFPVSGDDVLNAIAEVQTRRAERALRRKLQSLAESSSRAAGLVTRIAELADMPDRCSAAERLAEILVEATAARGVAIYLPLGDGSDQLSRFAATGGLTSGPATGEPGEVLDHARHAGLEVLPLALRKVAAGYALLRDARASREGGHVHLLAAQAATIFALLSERDRLSGGGTMKDPKSSAYSFAYYVDVAGREIDKARRYGRRFAIATVVAETPAETPPQPAEIADHVLKAVRDTDVLARVDESEFYLLLPETDGLGAHACRRRVLAGSRTAPTSRRARGPSALSMGVASYPHDGQDLAHLLRVARRRADASRRSVVHRVHLERLGLVELLDALELEAHGFGGYDDPGGSAQPLELPIAEAAALATTVVADALRGGAAFVVVAHHPGLSLGAAVRALLAAPRDPVTLHLLDLRASPGTEPIEALCVIAEHGSYALLGRTDGGVVRGVHAADPLLADLLAEQLGRAAGLRVFS